MLSGVFYSIHRCRRSGSSVSQFNPVFYMIDGFRFGSSGFRRVAARRVCPWLPSPSSPTSAFALKDAPRRGFTNSGTEPIPRIHQNLLRRRPCEFLTVEGDGHHFEAIIVSGEFAGKNRVQRQQRVNAVLKGISIPASCMLCR